MISNLELTAIMFEMKCIKHNLTRIIYLFTFIIVKDAFKFYFCKDKLPGGLQLW